MMIYENRNVPQAYKWNSDILIERFKERLCHELPGDSLSGGPYMAVNAQPFGGWIKAKYHTQRRVHCVL